MANSDISVSSVDHRQEPSTSTTFSIYGLAAVSITYLRSILAPILGHQMEHVSKIDRRTTKHGARFRITVPEDRQRNIIQRLERQSKKTHWRIRQNYRHRRPDQPRPTAPPPPLSRQILAVNVANISNKRPAIRHIVRNTRLWAISETCITSSKFRFTVPGFDVIQHPATGPGRRGIALGIPSCFGGHEHGSAVGTMILAKVPNFTPECLWIVGSVYVGHSGATTNYSRREAFASIRQALDRVVPFDNNHPVLIFGDWNTDPQRLQRIVHSWGHGLTVMQFSGSQITRLSTVHGRRHSSIDHFVCNAPARALLTSPRVDRQTAVADHFVIRTSIRAEAQGQPPAPRAPTISRHHCLEATDRIATSNYWDVLADATRSNRRLLSGTTKRAILASNTARQAFISAATNRNPDPVQCNTLRDEWSRLKAAATQLERVDGRKQWAKHADNLDRAVSDGRTDLVFAAARAMSGNSSRSAAVTPLYNSDGVVQYDPTSIMRVMQGHYGSLAADTTGHSLDLQYWHDRQPIQVSPNTPPIRNSDILDQDFSWNQIAAALLQMSPRKAPGDDGITTAFYQAALYMPANTQEGVPPTPFARALLRVCGQVFASATIPRAWLCASIVSIDKKDGDPLNPGDKRGIALINVGLKLVCKVLQMRIERFVETNNLLSYEQAGFRKREECVGQVVSLVDIIQRRQNAGLNTHVLFIDIRKAFDTVPVGALLWKLQNMGFPRRTLAFLKALYTSSSARARAGSLLSDPFPVQRGVRQGCPLSGLLFNLFINDILDGVAPITVPGLPRDTNPIRGLMYADDVAVFADSEQSLLAASTAIEQWAIQWEMQFGVAKCGIISFTGHLVSRLDNPLDIRLHGQLVSRVESYKYLGVLIDSKLDHSAWLKQKRFALEHTISALYPVLANHQLTVNYRSRIFSAVVMGKAYYGLELVGGNKSHLAPLQTTINKGIRLFTGARLSTAIGPLLVETGIGSLLTRSLVSRVRLLERSVTKRTPINAIGSGTDNDVFTLNVQGQLVRSQRWFWSRQTKQLYRNRYWLTPQVRPKTVKQRHSFALMETLRTCGDSASLQKYVTRQFLDTSRFFKDPSFDQSRAHGTRYLMLARMDALWTARKAIQIGILVDTHPFSVDRCILCDQQLLSTSIAHLVVECEQVTGHRIQSGLVPAIQKSRLRLLGRALDPGVENVYTWLRGGVINGEADLDQRWLDGTVEHESMGTRHDNRALAARNHGKGKPAPSGAFTHRIREDGEVFSSEEGRETSSDTTPLASVAGSVRMRSTDSDRSVRATPKKARDASPPPQDDLWVVVKNLSQQFAAQQTELATLSNTIALQQKATANLEKILSNMASQAASTSEATQAALAAILARLEVGPVVPKVVVADIDYPPLPPTGATSKRKTVATKPNPTTTTATTTTTTTTGQPSKNTRFADAVKRRLTHQQLVERQPDFRKAGAAAWLALKRETSVPAHSAPKVELSSGLRLIYASGFPYAKPGDLRKAMQGARIRTSAVRDIRWISRQVVQLLVDADYVSAFTRIITSLDATIVKSFKAWVPRSEAAEKDKLAAISSFAVKTVTTIQRSPDVKARNFFRSLLASIGGKTLEVATAEAAKIRVQTPDFSISTLETVPKESLPVKKATEKEPAAPAADPPSDTAAEVNPAIQDDGATPTVTPIADVEMCL
ncbi:hypothetical protein BASA83_011033 [Batrachochytrium salamandrivorans]|nr:hypothetical protein BASA83_011033 [Batrachochytrium salamandrivorans]